MSATDDLIKQILASSNTAKWTGEGKGSAQANAADMAKLLSDIGITDVKQFGLIDKPATITVRPDNQGGFIDEKGNPVDPKLVKEDYISGGESGNDQTVYTAPGTIQVYGNKLTGQAVGNTYGERQSGDFFGGTYTGKGNTGYGVQFKPDGTPVFYTQGASSNDVAKIMEDLGPIANIAAAAIGGPAAVAALSVAAGKPIKDVLKSAALSYLGGEAGNMVSGSAGLTDILGKAGTEALSGAAKQFVSSGGKTDPLQLLVGAGLNYGANTFGDQLGMGNLTETQRKMLNTALSGAAGKQSLEQILMNVAMTGVMNQKKSPADEMTVKGEPDNLNDFLASIDQYKVDQNADASGQGYYDEITGKFIQDDLGGLQNPLGPETGNFDPDKEWEYKLVRPGVWADADGNELDMSYLPNSETALTGEEIMRKAGALPGGGTSNIKVPTPKGSTPSTTSPDSSLASMIAAMNGGQQTIQVPSQDPFAHIKLMKDLFGTNVDLTPTDSSDNAPSQKSSRSEQDDETASEDAE